MYKHQTLTFNQPHNSLHTPFHLAKNIFLSPPFSLFFTTLYIACHHFIYIRHYLQLNHPFILLYINCHLSIYKPQIHFFLLFNMFLQIRNHLIIFIFLYLLRDCHVIILHTMKDWNLYKFQILLPYCLINPHHKHRHHYLYIFLYH